MNSKIKPFNPSPATENLDSSQDNNSPVRRQPVDASVQLWQAIAAIVKFQSQAPPLQPTPRDRDIPLSFTQERLWFLDRLEPGTAAYNIPLAFRLRGTLNLAALEQSLREILHRHEILHSICATVAGKPVLKIMPPSDAPLAVIDLRELPEQKRKEQEVELLHQNAQNPFDLDTGPLWRATLLQLDSAEYILSITVHHIIFDGWSEGILLRELGALYNAFCTGQSSPLSELPIQYADFAVWQRQWLQGDFLQALLDYWKAQLDNKLSKLQLPTDHPQPTQPTRRSACCKLILPQALTESLKTFSRQEKTTLFATLLAAFNVLLHRYTEQENVFVCSPIANRNRKELQSAIGYFVNLLILRTDCSGNPSFRELLVRVRQTVSGAYAHQDLPTQQLVENLNGAIPLSQVMFVLQNTPQQALELSDLTVSPLDVDSGTANFDLALSMVETSENLTGVLKYNADLFEQAAIAQMLQHFQAVLEQAITQPDTPLSQLLPLNEAEQEQLKQKRRHYNLTDSDSCQRRSKQPYIKPQISLELQLVNIWEKVLKIQPIGVQDNFFDLGGESLLAMGVFNQIEKLLGRELSVNLLLEAPTIAQLAKVLEQESGAKTTHSSLIPLQVSGSKPPLFLVPPGASTVLHFAPLLHYLERDRPVYGFNYLGMEGEQLPHTCVEDMATRYIQELRTLQPEGPYFLAGRCFGGVIAFEMAQQLHEQGQKVALLAILDTLIPPGQQKSASNSQQPSAHDAQDEHHNQTKLSTPDSQKSLGYYFRRLDNHIKQGELVSVLSSRLQGRVLRLLGRVHQKAADHETFLFSALAKVIFSALPQNLRIQFVFSTQKKARRKYRPKVYPGKITLFSNTELVWESQQGWIDLAGGGLDVQSVPGDHKTMFREPHVKVTAEKLNASLNHAQQIYNAKL